MGKKKKNLILINSQCQHNFEELSKSQNMTSKKYLSFCSKSHFSNKKILKNPGPKILLLVKKQKINFN